MLQKQLFYIDHNKMSAKKYFEIIKKFIILLFTVSSFVHLLSADILDHMTTLSSPATLSIPLPTVSTPRQELGNASGQRQHDRGV